MPKITHWTGTIWGTNSGTVVADFSVEGEELQGQILLFEPSLGQTRATVEGRWTTEGLLDANLTQFSGQLGLPMNLPSAGAMRGSLDQAKGIVSGTWSTNIGTKGEFILAEVKTNVPFIGPPTQTATSPQGPLITITMTLSSYRLDRHAFQQLIEVVGQGTNVTVPAINAVHAGHEYIHLGIESFERDPNIPPAIDSVIISANEPAIGKGTRTVTLNLKKSDPNILFVSGYDSIWVEGKATQIRQFLNSHEAPFVGFLRRRGPTLNSILFLLLLGLLPSIPSLKNRFFVLAIVFALLLALSYTWTRMANTRIFLRREMIPWHTQYAEWILAPVNLLLGALIAYLIQKYVR